MSRTTILPDCSEPQRDTEPEQATYVDLVVVKIDAYYVQPADALAVSRPPGDYAYALMPLARVHDLARRERVYGDPELWDGSRFSTVDGDVELAQGGDELVGTGSLSHLTSATVMWSAPSYDVVLCALLEGVTPRDRLAVKRICDAAPRLLADVLKEELGREPAAEDTHRRALLAVGRALISVAEVMT